MLENFVTLLPLIAVVISILWSIFKKIQNVVSEKRGYQKTIDLLRKYIDSGHVTCDVNLGFFVPHLAPLNNEYKFYMGIPDMNAFFWEMSADVNGELKLNKLTLLCHNPETHVHVYSLFASKERAAPFLKIASELIMEQSKMATIMYKLGQ
jgi:hypothetical protein